MGADPFEGPPYRVDKRRYFAREFMQLEAERLWPRVWLMAAPLARLRRPGDYAVFDVGSQSVLLTHAADGTLRAFHNVCMHRGTRLVDGAGNAPRLRCAYHGWQWGLAGKLERAPGADGFPHGIAAECRSLAPVACEAWAGFAWVCLGEPQQSLAEYLGPIGPAIEAYRPEELVLTRDFSCHWQSNWKTALDAFSETYHVNATHPQLTEALDPTLASFEFYGVHGLLKVPVGLLGPDASQAARDDSAIMQQLRELGVDVAAFRNDEHAARAALQAAIRHKASQVGADFGRLADEQLTDTRQFFLFPNLHFDFHGCNNFTIFRYLPHGTDPERSSFDFLDFSRPSFLGYSKEWCAPHEELEDAQLPETIRQDATVIRRVQRGMTSDGFGAPLLHRLECRILHVHRSLDRYLVGP